MLNPARPLIRSSGRSDKGTGGAASAALKAATSSSSWSAVSFAGMVLGAAAIATAATYGISAATGVNQGRVGDPGPRANTTDLDTLMAGITSYNASMFMGKDGAQGPVGVFDPNTVLYAPTLVRPTITGNGTWDTPIFHDATSAVLRATDTLFADRLWSIHPTLSLGGGPGTSELQLGLGANMSRLMVGTQGDIDITVGNQFSRLHLFGTIFEYASQIVRINQSSILLGEGNPVGGSALAGIYVQETGVDYPLVAVAATRDAVEMQAPNSVRMRLDQSVDTTSSPVFAGITATTVNGRSLAALINALDTVDNTREVFVPIANASLIALRRDVGELRLADASLNATLIATGLDVAALWTGVSVLRGDTSELNATLTARISSLQSTTSTSLNVIRDDISVVNSTLTTRISSLQSTVSTLLVTPAITLGGSWTGAPTISTIKGPGTAIFSQPTLSVDDTYAMVGAAQTLSAKTMPSPTLTGTVSGSATYIAPVIMLPAVTNGTFESPQINHIVTLHSQPVNTVTNVHANTVGLVLSAGSNDMTGVVSFTVSGSMTTPQTSGACTKIVTVVFRTPYPFPPAVLLVPADVLLVHQTGTGNRMPFYQSTVTDFSVCAGTAALQNVFVSLRYVVFG